MNFLEPSRKYVLTRFPYIKSQAGLVSAVRRDCYGKVMKSEQCNRNQALQ